MSLFACQVRVTVGDSRLLLCSLTSCDISLVTSAIVVIIAFIIICWFSKGMIFYILNSSYLLVNTRWLLIALTFSLTPEINHQCYCYSRANITDQHRASVTTAVQNTDQHSVLTPGQNTHIHEHGVGGWGGGGRGGIKNPIWSKILFWLKYVSTFIQS